MATSFKVRSGFHSDGATVYRKGQVFESDKPLHKMFPNKFDIVANDVTKKKSKEAPKKKARYNRVEVLEDIGKDVTQKFPDAVNQGLRVYQLEDGEYNVTDERDLYTPLNKKPMTRTATKKFLLDR